MNKDVSKFARAPQGFKHLLVARVPGESRTETRSVNTASCEIPRGHGFAADAPGRNREMPVVHCQEIIHTT